MIYSHLVYPLDLFKKVDSVISDDNNGHLIIYTQSNTEHIARLTPYRRDNSYIVETLWSITETTGLVPFESVTHISLRKY